MIVLRSFLFSLTTVWLVDNASRIFSVRAWLKKSRGGLQKKVVKLVKVVETSGVIFWEKPKMQFLRSFFVFTNQRLNVSKIVIFAFFLQKTLMVTLCMIPDPNLSFSLTEFKNDRFTAKPNFG